MGQTPSRQAQIRKEWKRNKDNRIFLFVGDAQCGKTALIEQIISTFSTHKTTVETQYTLQSFTVNETSMIGDSKETSIASQDKATIYDNLNVDKAAEINFDANGCHAPVIASLPMLLYGYIREQKIEELYAIVIPNDIIEVISQFMAEVILLSHKIVNKRQAKQGQIFELWECSYADRINWHLLYQYHHLLIFVVDLSVYDEFYNDQQHGKINKLRHALELFEAFILQNNNAETLRGKNMMLIFNKIDVFQSKIIKQGIPLNRCDLFADYQYDPKQYINDRRLDFSMKTIRKTFEQRAKTYMHENQLLGVATTNALDETSVSVAFENSVMVGWMDKSNLVPSNPSLS